MAGKDAVDLAKMDPEFETFLKSIPAAPQLDGDIPTLRKMLFERKKALNAAQNSNGPPEGVKEEDITIPARDGYEIPVRLYKPKSPPSGSPLVVMFHGGGFCLGGIEAEELNCRLFAEKLGCVCVNVDYRLAPEHRFPVGVNDSWDAAKWAAANASKLGADPSKGFILGGTSAGGNISAVLSHLARDEKLSPPLTGVLLLIPAVMENTLQNIPDEYKHEIISYEQNKDAPILSEKAILNFMDNYKPDLKSHLFNLFAPPTNFSNLPPTVFQICGMDPLRDEALIYERVLREDHNTKTKKYVYPGVPHGFWSVAPYLESSRRFVQDTVDGVKWLLEQK